MPVSSSQYYGVEIPVFDGNMPIMHPLGVERRERRGEAVGQTFIRPISLLIVPDPPEGLKLTDILDRTDEQLDIAAGLCGALAVGHKWGLYPINTPRGRAYRHYRPIQADEIIGFPANHILAARVDVIRGGVKIAPDSSEYLETERALDGYNQHGDPELTDLGAGQIIKGYNINRPHEAQPATGLWLVDIEPHIFWPAA
jgi:hypothetical protein